MPQNGYLGQVLSTCNARTGARALPGGEGAPRGYTHHWQALINNNYVLYFITVYTKRLIHFVTRNTVVRETFY